MTGPARSAGAGRHVFEWPDANEWGWRCTLAQRVIEGVGNGLARMAAVTCCSPFRCRQPNIVIAPPSLLDLERTLPPLPRPVATLPYASCAMPMARLSRGSHQRINRRSDAGEGPHAGRSTTGSRPISQDCLSYCGTSECLVLVAMHGSLAAALKTGNVTQKRNDVRPNWKEKPGNA